jgi:hypothetical protein
MTADRHTDSLQNFMFFSPDFSLDGVSVASGSGHSSPKSAADHPDCAHRKNIRGL